MAQPIIQTSFNSGEWAPALNARVDLAKYHSAAALLRNFFVDYRGGATTRPGTRYIQRTLFTTAGTVRLIPFQASFTVSYILEFGPGYVRFYNNGNPVLENAVAITGITRANPGVVTAPAHGYTNGDWVFLSNVGGMTQVNGNYYVVASATTNTFALHDFNGNNVNTSAFTAYTSGGTTQRVYTINLPYLANEIFGIKYAQNVNILVLTHPNHPPSQLVLNVNNTQPSWTFSAILFGSPVPTPSVASLGTTHGAGPSSIAYVVTAVDTSGNESAPTVPAHLNSIDYAATNGTQTITMFAQASAASFNIYKANQSFAGPVPAGVPFGFIGNTTTTTFIDSAISPDFSQTAPVVQNPFQGAGVTSLILQTGGSGWTNVPTPTFTAAPVGGTTATAFCSLIVQNVILNTGGVNYLPADIITDPVTGLQIQVNTTGVGGAILTFTDLNQPVVASGPVPAAIFPVGTHFGSGAVFNLVWSVVSLQLSSAGAGYLVAPSVSFLNGGGGSGATATVTLGAASSGNPTVPGFHQQRMFLGGQVSAPSQFNLSQPGAIYNFNITYPTQADNAIQASLTNTTLNSIQSIISVSAGLIILADKGAWLLNGGSAGSPIDALDLVANAQAYSGASGLPPIVTPNDILYVQAKGSIVRDLSFNFYLNNYVGADISVLSSHLFYTFSLTSWAWAEEPFHIAWAVRNDGDLLSLTFVKEQELIAWAHSDTQGSFQSVATVTEQTSIGSVDAVYFVVSRTINGASVQYIERFVELNYPQDYKSSWQVDAGIQYSGMPATNFSGATHLAGMPVTGVADGAVFTTTISATGTFTLTTPASLVTVGLSFLPQLKSLAVDLGEPTAQGKVKSVSGLNLRVANTLGLSAGKDFDSDMLPIQDLILGNVSTMLTGLANQTITGLVTGDAFMILPPQYDPFGQICIQQSNPYPATILGIIPHITVGDTP